MGGNPFKVGLFPHTVRMNLMKSHIQCEDISKSFYYSIFLLFIYNFIYFILEIDSTTL